MIKRIIIALLFVANSNAQEVDERWFRTPENQHYEKDYKYLVSEFKDGVLKDEVSSFVEKYLKYEEDEAVIQIKVLFSAEYDVKVYQITYSLDYYNAYRMNIQKISKIKNYLIFIEDSNLSDFVIDKKILYGLARDRYPRVTEDLNQFYKEEPSVVPAQFPTLTHGIPELTITIKDNKVLDRKIDFDGW